MISFCFNEYYLLISIFMNIILIATWCATWQVSPSHTSYIPAGGLESTCSHTCGRFSNEQCVRILEQHVQEPRWTQASHCLVSHWGPTEGCCWGDEDTATGGPGRLTSKAPASSGIGYPTATPTATRRRLHCRQSDTPRLPPQGWQEHSFPPLKNVLCLVYNAYCTLI